MSKYGIHSDPVFFETQIGYCYGNYKAGSKPV